MATGGRWYVRAAGAAVVACFGAFAGATGPTGYVVMPHPNACRCANEEQGFCEGLWEKMRPGHRDRYLTHQHRRHLNNPECPPWCMENYGHYRTCWRRYPEHTLGCRDCWGAAGALITAPPAALVPAPMPAPPAPTTLPEPSTAPSEPMPPMDYDPMPAPEPESAPTPEIEALPEVSRAPWSDPAWRAGMRQASLTP